MINAKKIGADTDMSTEMTLTYINPEFLNAITIWADKVIEKFPRFHSPKSRQFKCNKCSKLHKWVSGQVTIECDCKKRHIRILGLGALK